MWQAFYYKATQKVARNKKVLASGHTKRARLVSGILPAWQVTAIKRQLQKIAKAPFRVHEVRDHPCVPPCMSLSPRLDTLEMPKPKPLVAMRPMLPNPKTLRPPLRAQNVNLHRTRWQPSPRLLTLARALDNSKAPIRIEGLTTQSIAKNLHRLLCAVSHHCSCSQFGHSGSAFVIVVNRAGRPCNTHPRFVC